MIEVEEVSTIVRVQAIDGGVVHRGDSDAPAWPSCRSFGNNPKGTIYQRVTSTVTCKRCLIGPFRVEKRVQS